MKINDNSYKHSQFIYGSFLRTVPGGGGPLRRPPWTGNRLLAGVRKLRKTYHERGEGAKSEYMRILPSNTKLRKFARSLVVFNNMHHPWCVNSFI